MTGGEIATVLTALAALVTAIGTVYIQRQKRTAIDAKALESERNQLRRAVEAALRHIYNLDLLLASHGLDGPEPPAELTTTIAGTEGPP